MVKGDGRGVWENVGGAVHILYAAFTPFLRGRRERWGSSAAEQQRAWPGDDLVRSPRWGYLNGIIINATPEGVWPWLAQVGQGRGGFYSFERLENLVGCRIRNADRVLGEHQDVSRGDEIRLAAGAPPLTVALVEAERALVLLGGDLRGEGRVGRGEARISWGFFLEPVADGRCQLLSRYRAAYGRGAGTALAYGPWVTGPISLVMQRKMLRGIKLRAERWCGSADPDTRDTLAG